MRRVRKQKVEREGDIQTKEKERKEKQFNIN
jgi:hypothetical protein